MEEKIIEILKDLFELETVDSTCSQETCELWDSMGSLNLAVELEMEFGVSLTPSEISNLHCYNDIVSLLKSKGL